MNDLLIFISFAAFVLSPCLIAMRSRDQHDEARLGPRLVPARAPRSSRASREKKKLIVDSLPRERQAARREASSRHARLRDAYSPYAVQEGPRRRKNASVFIPPTRQAPVLGYTSSPVPALVYGLPQTSSDDLLLLVLPGGRVPQRPLRSF